MRSVIAWIITNLCLPQRLQKWSYDQRFLYSRRLWREVDSTIKISLTITLAFLVIVFLFSFTPVCDEAGNCNESGYSYFAKSTPNEVGDTLAGLAGSLAFLWLITTVFLQGKELREQRKELKLARIAQQEQVAAFDEQRFEALFGELFSNMPVVISNLEITLFERVKTGYKTTDEVTELKGRRVVESFVGKLTRRLERDRDELISKGAMNESGIRKIYESEWREFEAELGLYLRFLYNFYRVIDESPHARTHHHRLIRSLLNRDDLTLLFYNCFTKQGENFLKYTKKYDILDNLPENWEGTVDRQLFDELTDQVWQREGWK